jgi:hypothetical protein
VAITEEDRHRLYQRLEEVLGREQAATMMEHLPPVGWADVATKRDLDHLAERVEARFDGLRAEIAHQVERLSGAITQQGDALAHQVERLSGAIAQQGDQLRAEWRHELQQQVYVLVGANVAVAAAVVAAIRL